MIFRPDIKPPMWGPPDAVRYAVQANAERLGIDPKSVLSLHPLWEGSGDILESLGSASSGSRNTATWNADGLITGSGNGLTATTTLTNPLARQHTVLSVITLNQNRKQGFYQRRETAGGAGLVVGQFDTDGVVRAYVGSSSVSQRSVFVPTVGKQFASCVVADLNLTNADRVKMFFNGLLDPSTASGTHATTGLTTYASEIGYTSSFASFSWLRMDGVFHFYADFDGAISNDAACALTAAPYALLMPVARPVYFDLGASGNTDSSADPGNIAISGSSATGVKTSVSSANSGTIAIAGSVASGIRSLVSLAAAASIAIAGFSAEGVYTPTGSTVSSAGPGAVAISGSPANGVQTHISSADPGTVVILGSDANSATGYATTAEPGTVAITGADATASRTFVATAGPTSIAISGSPAYATKSGGSSTSSGISLIFGKVILHL